MSTSTPPRRAWVEEIMGMPVSVHLRGPGVDSDEVAQHVTGVFVELRAVDAMFNPAHPDSQIARLNRGEIDFSGCHPAIRTVHGLCEEAHTRTDGFFNPWLPDPEAKGGYRYDPSGLVKGWAVQRIADRLADLDGHDLCLNAGGDVVLTTVPGHPVWRVGIEDPAEPNRMLRVCAIATGAVATAGAAHRGGLVVNPFTGQDATALRSVTVAGPSLLWADVFAIAAVARGAEGFDWLSRLEEYEALVVDETGALRTTSGWDRLVLSTSDPNLYSQTA
ncbi:thiamine biosynthesis lipoprotein [Catenuloplanes nepalensis]|uniref:FAD:protein FMN transferase n=1 Tax=Catenuloplanes nepalensis TaxID=587533 RepID=A0ABT9MKI2_9ACTN|nr:FAD:protein FMN transferase [Catenuloplanes nepalensis]MDP9791923.1 thiamine biosynthesis lipoprotein [Catenuloplanes nepalensis]